jgi:hypothetical protein
MEESSSSDNDTNKKEPAAAAAGEEENDDDEEERPIKVLIITMGGARRAALEELLLLQQHDRCNSRNVVSTTSTTPATATTATTTRNKRIIEATFIDGVPSRELRARRSFAAHCHRAGLLPAVEWEAVRDDDNNKGMSWEEALANVPTPVPGGRHFLLDLWHRSKALSRDRAVLACTLAHLTAMRRLVGATAEEEVEEEESSSSFDAILEDNVRWDPHTVWQTIRDIQRAKRRYDQQQQQQDNSITTSTVMVHMQYFGWLGSVPNLRWTYGSHIPRHHHHHHSIVPFPDPQDILDDVATGTYTPPAPVVTAAGDRHDDNRAPGGNPIWGAYGYWISASAYETVLTRLENDVGALLWKGKRQRRYRVKPIDKILPRLLRNHYGNTSVQLCLRPAFFRAPMLTSHIHTSFDPEFCRSTTWQLRLAAATMTTTTTPEQQPPPPPQPHDNNNDNNNDNDDWSRLALTETERAAIAHWRETGEWITPAQLQLLQHQQPPPSLSL